MTSDSKYKFCFNERIICSIFFPTDLLFFLNFLFFIFMDYANFYDSAQSKHNIGDVS